jgi:hypothetical protein
MVIVFTITVTCCNNLIAQNTITTFPDTTWMQYATPEEAGWSSEGIDRARTFADSLGSKAVILVYNGAIVMNGEKLRRSRSNCIDPKKSFKCTDRNCRS